MQLDIREHLDYVALFACLDLHGRWMELWTRRHSHKCVREVFHRGGIWSADCRLLAPELGSASKLDAAQYRDEVAAVVDELHKNVVELLEGEWLKLDGLDSTVDAAGAYRIIPSDLLMEMSSTLSLVLC